MARFIGSNRKEGNWGEDYFVEKLIEYCDDSYIIYRNRQVFGAQFDVCLLCPNFGIIIFEVKGWRPETIKRVIAGDTIVIKSVDENTGKESEAEENPIKQGRGYTFKMISRIRERTGKNPLVYCMACLPGISKQEYIDKRLDTVCEYEETFLKEDLESKAAFLNKFNASIRNHKAALEYRTRFTPELMFETRQIFEPDVGLEEMLLRSGTNMDHETMSKKIDYSLLAYIPHDKFADSRIKELADCYACGTKLYLLVKDLKELQYIADCINSVIASKGLMTVGENLKILFDNKPATNDNVKDSFFVFNCSAFLVSGIENDVEFFIIKNGKVSSKELEVLQLADVSSKFNLSQYNIEHCNPQKNVIVRAGAGTGKTFTMISRIAFVCHMRNCSMKEMANRIVMITFTNEAANQMEEKIKQYFNNYYLLTGEKEYLEFINQIEGMQISTIHSYAKKIISKLGIQYGYGNEISVTSADYYKKELIAREVDNYIRNLKNQRIIEELQIPVYKINNYIKIIIEKLYNQSVNIAQLDGKNFGFPIDEKEWNTLHLLFSDLVPLIAKQLDIYYRDNDKVHLNNMMSILHECVNNQENHVRLSALYSDSVRFMFVDEFQDTDDVQIEILMEISKRLGYKLFVVGDVKQCIYRFRGAKENAFDQLGFKGNKEWLLYSLTKNYRTDHSLLDLFHNSFMRMGKNVVGGEPLLIYGNNADEESSRLVGTCSYNEVLSRDEYYRKVSINSENDRMEALFSEIEKQKAIINDLEIKNKCVLGKKEREIAILVRENWQADLIRSEGKKRGISIVTNTGGDLYVSEPALDMLKLANALLHYDESDYLYEFVTSNFIDSGNIKAQMYNINTNKKNKGWKKEVAAQNKSLELILNYKFKEKGDQNWTEWAVFIDALRTVPTLQVLRKLYQLLKPWENYSKGDTYKEDYYKLNVDLLFEKIIESLNMDSISILAVAEHLSSNMWIKRNVDSRVPEPQNTDDIIVRCVTVHKSKGLEYGSVILPYCSASINVMKKTDINVSVFHDRLVKVGLQIKSDNNKYQNNYFDESLEKNERMREEARILYVAMTRAIRAFSWIALSGKSNKCWQNLIWEGK